MHGLPLTLLLLLPGLAQAAPAPRDGWRDPYNKPAARTAPRTAPRAAAATPAPRAAPPTRATPSTPAAPPTRTAPPTLPTPRPTVPAEEMPQPDPHATPVTLHRHKPARTRLWHLRLAVGSHNLLVRHASLNPLKSNDLFAQGGVSGGLELTVLPGLVVGAEVGWVGGRFTDSAFGTDSTAVDAHALRVGARVGYRLWDTITPYVRGGFSATWLSARIDTDTQSLGGRAFAPGAYALAGVEITIRRNWMRRVFKSRVFTLGLLLEAGWVHLGRFKLDGGRGSSGLVDDYRAGLGRLTLSGVTVNAGLVLAF